MQYPHITATDVQRSASTFLADYHSSLELPIPIEDIVELKMQIALSVIPGIKDLIGVDSFISSDFQHIVVDEFSFTKYVERTRFSLAHEIGHLILHKDWYEKYGPENLEDYLSFYDRIDPEQYKFMEIQAHTFAGLVLVPTEPLKDELAQRLGKVPHMEQPEILAPIFQDLLNTFQVSGEVMLRRLQKEEIVESNSK